MQWPALMRKFERMGSRTKFEFARCVKKIRLSELLSIFIQPTLRAERASRPVFENAIRGTI
jgi:hypothetical protein